MGITFENPDGEILWLNSDAAESLNETLKKIDFYTDAEFFYEFYLTRHLDWHLTDNEMRDLRQALNKTTHIENTTFERFHKWVNTSDNP